MHDQRFNRFDRFNRFNRQDFRQYQKHRQQHRMVMGIAIAVIGAGFLLRTLGILPCFTIDFSWPFILIFIGIIIGLKSGFRNVSSWILILIGTANITPQFMFMGHPSRDFALPALAIVAGLAIAFRPSRQYCFPGKPMESSINSESNLNIDVTFGGKKEVITSKDFKGGIVSVTFAGCEINLTQADFAAPEAILDFRVSFGGVELIVPANWEVQNEISSSFGSVEDERTIHAAAGNEPKKTLILRGTCSFGSIEIKSY